MIYFDNAATTMIKPTKVVDAVTKALISLGNANRGASQPSMDASHLIYETRKKVAQFFGGNNPSQVVFTSNATESLNVALKGILKPKDHVITTELEHNSVLRPLYELEKNGVELTILKSDKKGNFCYEDIEKNIRKNTKVFVCTHGSNVTGNVIDIKRIGEITKKHHLIFIVDASQTAGLIPIDVDEMNIDVLCFTGHKSLLAPQGTGGMYIKEGIVIRPLKTGGSGIQTFHTSHPTVMPTALEAGTLNAHGLAGLHAALSYIDDIGILEIQKKELKLMWYFYNYVKEIPEIKVYGDFTKVTRCPIVSLNCDAYDSQEISNILSTEYGISTRAGGHCAPLMHKALNTVEQGVVRFSFSHFNTMEEVKSAIYALQEIL